MSCPSLDLQTNKLPKLNPHSLQAPRQTTNPYLRPLIPPAAEWDRYYTLVAKRRNGVLSEDESAELTAASNRIEEQNARRMEHLAELARLRNVTLTELLDQLGIVSPPVI